MATTARIPVTESTIATLRARIDTINTLLAGMRTDQFGTEIYNEVRYTGVRGPAAFRYSTDHEDHHADAAKHLAAALKSAENALAPLVHLARLAEDHHRLTRGRR